MTESETTIPTTESTPSAPRKVAGVTAWEWLSFTSMRVVLQGILRIVGLCGLYRLSRAFAQLEYLINYKRRKRVWKMQDVVLDQDTPSRTRKKWVRESFMRSRCDKVFYLIFDLIPKKQLAECFEIVNKETLDAALARGKGVYAMTSHIGSGHVLGMLFSFMGYRVSGVRKPYEGAVRRFMQQRWVEKYPDRPPITFVYTGDFVRPIYRLFKDNFILGSSLDVSNIPDKKMRRIPVRIFGREQEFLVGPLQIAIRCEATVLPTFTISDTGFRYRLEFLDPLTDPDAKDESPETLSRVMQEYADAITKYARKYPDHITRR